VTAEKPLRIRLFVAGDSPSSVAAREVLERHLPAGSAARCEFIDVLSEPDRALEAGLIATPTLILEEDGREHRYVGDLRDQRELQHRLETLGHATPAGT